LHIQRNKKNGGYNNCYFKVVVCRDVGKVVILLKRERWWGFGGMIGGMRILENGMARLFNDLVGGWPKSQSPSPPCGSSVFFLVGMARESNR